MSYFAGWPVPSSTSVNVRVTELSVTLATDRSFTVPGGDGGGGGGGGGGGDDDVTVTIAVCVIATPLIVARTVLDSAVVELSVPVATPLAFVGAAGCVSVLPLPVAERTTVAPPIGLSLASRAVTVIVELPLPAWIDVGDAVTPDCDAEITGGGGGGGGGTVSTIRSSTGTRSCAMLWSSGTITIVSRYTALESPEGLSVARSVSGLAVPVAITSHGALAARCAVHGGGMPPRAVERTSGIG